MNVYRISSCEHISDLSGEGAFLYGGRWNNKGTRLLYTSEHPSLAMLEALTHITMIPLTRSYCKIGLYLGDAIGWIRNHNQGQTSPINWFMEISEAQLPLDWRKSPGPDQLRKLGDAFVDDGKYLAMKVPSVVEPDSWNFLLNPAHDAFALINQFSVSPIFFDQRLLVKK